MTPYQRALWFDAAARVVLDEEQRKAPESEAERVVSDEIEPPAPE